MENLEVVNKKLVNYLRYYTKCSIENLRLKAQLHEIDISI